MSSTTKEETFSFQLLESFLSILTLLIGQLLKLIDMALHPARFSWLSVTGSSLLLMVLLWLTIKLGRRLRKKNN